MVARREETPVVHRSGESVATKLHRIAEKAHKEPGFNHQPVSSDERGTVTGMLQAAEE